MRLPDGFGGGGSERYGSEALQALWEGTIDTMTAVDGSATYTSASLQATLTALMQTYAPDRIHIQDHTTEHTDIEHSDHIHASEFTAAAAQDYSNDVTVTSYYGYATWGFDENVSGAEHEEMRTVFMEYAAHDPQVWAGEGQLIGAYEEWVQREYIAEEYTLSGGDVVAMMTVPHIEADAAAEHHKDAEEDQELELAEAQLVV